MNNISFGNLPNVYIPDAKPATSASEPGESASFTDVLRSAVDSVNQSNDSAASQVASLLQGGKGDMNSVMIAVEKADVSFELMMQVRNKIVSAYQDIEKMQF